MNFQSRIFLKRVYATPSKDDGFRILVDRLWPRGLSKEKAKADLWLKEVAPSDSLRKWFGHDQSKWKEFKRRYLKELAAKKEVVELIVQKAITVKVTLLYGAADEKHNNALILIGFISSTGSRLS
jgi:uncharacterized protein YeaO (DUF488 family)